MPRRRWFKKFILLLLIVLTASRPLSALAQPAQTMQALFAGSAAYETLFTGLILQAVQRALPIDAQAELIDYQADLRDTSQTPDAVEGEGSWRVVLRITRGDVVQTDTLSGSAAFSVALLSDGGRGSITHISGNLTGERLQAVFDTRVTARTSANEYTQQEAFTVNLTYEGIQYPARGERTERRFLPTFDTEELTSTVTVARGASFTSTESRIVSRFVDQDHREIWVESTTSGEVEAALHAHLWASGASGDSVELALVDYELSANNALIARLAAPGTISISNSSVTSALEFVDANNQPITVEGSLFELGGLSEGTAIPEKRHTARPQPQPLYRLPADSTPAESLPPMPILAMPLLGPCRGALAAGGAASAAAGAAFGTAAEAAYSVADFYDGLAGAGLRPSPGDASAVIRNSAESSIRSGAAGAVTGILVGALTNVIANRIKDQINSNPSLTPEERRSRTQLVDLANWAFNFGVGLVFVSSPIGLAAALAVGVASLPGGPLDDMTNAASSAASSLCNADPYFTQPDTPGRLMRSRAGPLTVHFVVSGIHTPPSAVAASSEPSSAASVEFRDNPIALLAGSVPTGASALGTWEWDASRPFNGLPSHRSRGTSIHYFIGAEPYVLADDEELIQYVYLNPNAPPRQLYIQIYTGDGNGEQRAYWGQNLAQTGGTAGTPSLYPMGPMPPAGEWLRLRIPAEALGLRGQPITGVLFGVVEGEAWWGTTTAAPRATDTAPDLLAVGGGLQRSPAAAGVQVGVQVHEAGQLSARVVTAEGETLRILRDAPAQKGLHILTWDGTRNDGSPTPTTAARLLIALDGREAADVPLSDRQLTAQILSPGPYAVIRGNSVPIVGFAEGEGFKEYVLEYSEGAAPTAWTLIARSDKPAALPRSERRVGFASANLGTWDVGLDEFGNYSSAGLQGLYTLRLRVIGEDDREAVTSVPVIVGRLASFAAGGAITSPDGAVQLTIPPGALTEPFVLLGVLPAEQTQPERSVESLLPSGLTPVSALYEILPAQDRFLQPITLTISTNEPNASLLLGDGTPTGWRTLRTTYHPDRQQLSAQLTDFGRGRRAFVGAFIGANVLPTTAAEAAFAAAPQLAPRLLAEPNAVAFYDDFVSGGVWRLLDPTGTQAEVVRGTAVGLPQDRYALQVTRASLSGTRYVQITDRPFDAAQFPIVVFDYRVQPDDGFNLLARVGRRWLQINLSGVTAVGSELRTVSGPPLVQDGAWHTMQVDLYQLLRDAFPDLTDFTVSQLALGQFERIAYDQIVSVDRGRVGQSYEIAQVAVLKPLNDSAIRLTADPTPAALTVNGVLGDEVALPAADGLYWLEVRHAAYPANAYFPVLVDRTPPQLLNPNPLEGGVGSPFALRAEVSERAGLDLAQAVLSVNGTSYTLTPNVYAYSLEALELYLNNLEPAPALPHQSEAAVSLVRLVDYAGNRQSAPFVWRFTVNTPPVQRDDLRQISQNGGSAPALSPQGDFIAYTADADGQSALLIARTDAPQTAIVTLLNSRSAAWSRRGDRIAFVQRTPRGDALQVADFNADGTLSGQASLLTGGLIESPTWSPEADELAVVLDGNVARVDVRTPSVDLLTSDPERPYRAAAWRPDGSALVMAFDLYERRLELLNLSDRSITPLTEAMDARQPAWLNNDTVLFSAPRTDGRGAQIWQIDVNSRVAAPFDTETPPGADDDQAAVSADGSTIAFVSTRSGLRDVWAQRALQITEVRLTPPDPAPGDVVQISYALPTDAIVTVTVGRGEPIPLLINATQTRGLQAVTWNTDSLSEGVYPIRVVAQVGERTIEQAAQVQLAAQTVPATPTVPLPMTPVSPATPTPAASVKFGRLEVNAYRDEATAARAENLAVEVFAAGTTTLIERSENRNPTVLSLPAGRYDVRLTYQNASGAAVVYTFESVEVIPDELARLHHPAAVGELRIDVLAAEGVPSLSDDTAITVYRAGDRSTPVRRMSFYKSFQLELQEGVYDIELTLKTNLEVELDYTFTSVAVQPGRTTRLEHVFPTARVRVAVSAGPDQPAFRDPTIEVYAPGDRSTPLARGEYNNPLTFVLPAGRYDFVVYNNTSLTQPDTFTLTDVALSPGQTLDLSHTFPTGRVRVAVSAGPDQPAFRDPTIEVYAPGDRSAPLARGEYNNPLTFVLPADRYDFVVYNNTSLNQPDTFTFTDVALSPGQTLDLSHTFPTGQIRLRFLNRDGQASASGRYSIFVPGQAAPILQGSTSGETSFTLPAGRYQVEIRGLDDSLLRRFDDVRVIAGQRLDLEHQISQ